MSDKNNAPFIAPPKNKQLPNKHQSQKSQDDIDKRLQQSRQQQQEITQKILESDDPIQQSQINKMRKTLEFIFKKSRDVNIGKAYYNDGDPKMYTNEIIEQRKQLKDHPQIKEGIETFMKLYNFDKYDCINKDEYLRVQVGVAKVLRPELFTQEKKDELTHLLEEDWTHDSQGGSGMTKQQVYNSLYELVDIWTPGIEPQQYEEFFYMLKEKIRVMPLPYNKSRAPYNIMDDI